jgi:hypothetical protein
LAGAFVSRFVIVICRVHPASRATVGAVFLAVQVER